MKRLLLVSTMLVFAIVLSACSEGAIEKEPAKEVSIMERAEASETKSAGKNTDLTSMEQNGEALQNGKYTNADLGFSMGIPAHWMDHLKIESGYWAEEADHSVDFYYAEGNMKEYLFSIVVYEREIAESEWENEVWGYIGTAAGKTFAYVISGEPSETILDENNKEHFHAVQTIINEELMDALTSFEFIKP